MTSAAIGPSQLREWLHDGREIALLDVRDGGPYSRSHVLVASSAPLAQFEVIVPQLVPRRTTRVVLVDDDESIVIKAAEMLKGAGYTDVSWLAGGNAAWASAGFRLFSGSGIISKAFGELVELELGTPHIEPEELEKWRTSGRSFVLVDSRPLAEYRTVSIPGATDCPGAELLYRVPNLVPDGMTPIVVNCAGRTRSIIGAQSLRDAGITNPVFALKNGTMGWHLAGLMTAHGESNMVAEPEGEALEQARTMARDVLEKDGLRVVSLREVEQWMTEPDRTTYRFDVRQPDAFDSGHVPGFLNAPGGQLIQATDSYIAVRNARIVVSDEHMIQSVMTAHWLSRMGWEVHVLRSGIDDMMELGRPAAPTLVSVDPGVKAMNVDGLADLIATGGCVVLDVGESYWYRQGRIPGSFYSMRSMLSSALTAFRHDSPLVFCCTNGSVAPHAAGDALELGFSDVRFLDGGRTAWRRDGREVEAVGDVDDERILTVTDDMWYPPWARSEGVEEAMLQYLTWEVGLLETVAEETYISFLLG